MTTNDLRRGDRVRLRSGWYATIEDDKRGNTRLARVEGFVTEVGSVYSHDVVAHIRADGSEVAIEHTPAQLKLQKRVSFLDAVAKTW